MKKFFSIFLILLILPQVLLFGDTLKNKIIRERMEKEKAEVIFAMKVNDQELEVAQKLASDSLLKYKKLVFLEKSSRIMKENCLSFDSECIKFYDISIAYLLDELHKTKLELDGYEKILSESIKRKKILDEKMAMLEKGVETEIASIKVKTVIPELKKFYKCAKKSGWNSARGVFITPEQAAALPFPALVKGIDPMKKEGYLLTAEHNGYQLNFAYVKSLNVKKDETAEANRKLFSAASGNPVIQGKVLLFITKNNQFINPAFVCE
ncbi:hypothetical protein J6253_09285 [bacterium]|nr:hypothetical protein [bacterium]MBP5592014.1 hypothetical protein [bacterium]